MILGKHELIRALTDGRMTISRDGVPVPLAGLHVEPASIDLTLARNSGMFPLPNSSQPRGNTDAIPVVDFRDQIQYQKLPDADALFIPAHGFCLASTAEYLDLDKDHAAYVEGRSSIGRGGLFIQNAGWVDPGFCGAITLELYNALPYGILVPWGLRICQVVVAQVQGGDYYTGKYQGQRTTVGSEIWKDC